MLTEETLAIIQGADATDDAKKALSALRSLSVDEFGELLLDVSGYPFLRTVLPSMPSDRIQIQWNGSSGVDLLRQTAPFVRFVEQAYEHARGRPLRNVGILDFGCGWGRITRILAKYVDAEHIWGLDPLNQSLDFCREHRVLGTFGKIDPIPTAPLPVGEPIDLAVVYSVFTHTSERTTQACLSAIREASAPGAVIVFTIRPVEFWALRGNAEMVELHRAGGFAFNGDGRMVQDGEDTYGETTMSQSAAERMLHDTGWTPSRFDRSLADENQTRVVALRS